MRLILSLEADLDLEEVGAYLGRHSSRASDRFVKAVERTFNLIAVMPEIAAFFPSDVPRLKGIRKFGIMGFPDYLIFYRVETDHVSIIRVLHVARDIRAILEGG